MPSIAARRLGPVLAALTAACLTSAWVYSNLRADEERTEETVGATAQLNANLEYSDASFLDLVNRYAGDGGDSVDYAAWQASERDMRALDDYIALIGRVSPKSNPDLFESTASARRYWINAYNAIVIDSVLDYWPLDSVRDVRVSLISRIVPGKGFFYDREIEVGGEKTNLLDLEKQVLESLEDPRIHFALNCASESCPVLRASDWSDAELDDAARDFINRPENVEVGDGVLYLSAIFKWYKKEFPRDIAVYLEAYAAPELKARLEAAAENDYRVRYRDYDWSLNDTKRD